MMEKLEEKQAETDTTIKLPQAAGICFGGLARNRERWYNSGKD